MAVAAHYEGHIDYDILYTENVEVTMAGKTSLGSAMKSSQRQVDSSGPTAGRPVSRGRKKPRTPRPPLRSYLILTGIILFFVALAVAWTILNQMFPLVPPEAALEAETPTPTRTPFPSLLFRELRSKETPSVYEE